METPEESREKDIKKFTLEATLWQLIGLAQQGVRLNVVVLSSRVSSLSNVFSFRPQSTRGAGVGHLPGPCFHFLCLLVSWPLSSFPLIHSHSEAQRLDFRAGMSTSGGGPSWIVTSTALESLEVLLSVKRVQLLPQTLGQRGKVVWERMVTWSLYSVLPSTFLPVFWSIGTF